MDADVGHPAVLVGQKFVRRLGVPFAGTDFQLAGISGEHTVGGRQHDRGMDERAATLVDG